MRCLRTLRTFGCTVVSVSKQQVAYLIFKHLFSKQMPKVAGKKFVLISIDDEGEAKQNVRKLRRYLVCFFFRVNLNYNYTIFLGQS